MADKHTEIEKPCIRCKRRTAREGRKQCESCLERDRQNHLKTDSADKKSARYYANHERSLKIKKNSDFKRKYGIDIDEFDRRVELQGGKCALCYKSSRLVVDHSHKTGAVRGLLCRGCNLGIGHLKESTETIERIPAYLSGQSDMEVPSDYSEIEIKLNAATVDPTEFNLWCNSKSSREYQHIVGPDDFYENSDGDIVRHRYTEDGLFNQITVKKRRSNTSIKDRLEINLTLAPRTSVREVRKFLEGVGYRRILRILKDSHIHWIDVDTYGRKDSTITVVLYTVKCDGFEDRRFIEVEVESKNIHKNMAFSLLNSWERQLRKKFGIKSGPLNESLFEIYSGKRYMSVSRKRRSVT